jgi:hypothetical protein
MSSKTVIVSLFACCISFAAGYYIKDNEHQRENHQTAKVKAQVTELSATQQKKDNATPTMHIPSSSSSTNEQYSFDVLEDFLDKHQDSNYLTITNKSLAPLYLQLSQLDAYLLQQKAQDLLSLLPNAAASRALGITLEVLAEQAPIAALDMALNLSVPEEFKWTYAWSVLSVWTANSPLDAYEWYITQDFSQSNLKGFGTENMVSTAVLSGLYSYDKVLAISKITELTQQNKLSAPSLSLISRDINNSEEFRDLLNALGTDKNSKMGRTEIAGEWFSKAPHDAAAWVNMLDEDKKNDHLLRHALNRWAESSPLQASDWYIKQFSEQQQPKAISQAATSFAARDPQAALDWVDSLNRSDTHFAIEEVLHRASYENPDFVIAHLDRVNEEQRKVSVLQSAIYSIHQQDPVKAQRIIDASPYKEKLQEYLNRINDY